MIDNENTYIRSRGLTMIGCNAKWDKNNKLELKVDIDFATKADIFFRADNMQPLVYKNI